MRTRIFQLDAFSSRRFRGNPAAVMPMEAFPPDGTMQSIAAENNLSETAFLVRGSQVRGSLVRKEGDPGGDYDLRWFTPQVEVPLCGHATLASAAVVMERLEPGCECVVFHTKSGPLTVERKGTGYAMNLPARPSEKIAPPPELARALGANPVEVTLNQFNYLAILEGESQVRDLQPDMAAVARIDRPGVIVSALGSSGYDFVSRYFAPAKGIPEDPVTGAAHCMLAPYWAKRLGKSEFRAYQASRRGGEVVCRLLAARGESDRVELQGECAFYLEGEVEI